MNTIQDQLTAAETANNTGNYAEAEYLCRGLLEQSMEAEQKVSVWLCLSESLWRRGGTQEALSFAEEALRSAQELQNKYLEAKAYANLGSVYFYLSDYSRSLELIQYALAISKEIDNKSGIAANLGNLGSISCYVSNYIEALEYLLQAISINKEVGDKIGLAKNINNLATVYLELSEYVHALEYFQQALTLNQELDNQYVEAIILGNIGDVYSRISDYSRAIEYLHQSLNLHEKLENKVGIAMSFSTLANLYGDISDYPRSLEYHHQALALYEEINYQIGVAMNLDNIGLLYRGMSDYARALEYYQRSLALHEKIGRKAGTVLVTGHIGSVYFDMSDYRIALEYYRQALTMAEEIGDTSRMATNLGNIGRVYGSPDFADYNPIIAEEYIHKAMEIQAKIGDRQMLYQEYKSLADFYKQQARWQEHAEYLQKYYDLRDEVQTEEAKKLADKFAFERQIAVMEKEREVTDMLLHKFLPSPIVNEVKAKEGKILVQQFHNISVLFADLVGFTKLSLSIKPEVMIEMLNFIFTKFDSIIKENGGHRIRTMGDGYFAICGAPDLVENHQYKLAKAALKFMEDIILPENIRKHLPEGTEIGIRIGLHCGEAVCGMVGGLEKWQYDAYGDTINTASRMESHGEPGKIHVSEDFKHALPEYDEFTFLPREPMFIKGKGMMNTYFLQ